METKSNTPLIVAIVVIAIVAIVGLFLYFGGGAMIGGMMNGGMK
jgi:preprotein translocase subunit SecG